MVDNGGWIPQVLRCCEFFCARHHKLAFHWYSVINEKLYFHKSFLPTPNSSLATPQLHTITTICTEYMRNSTTSVQQTPEMYIQLAKHSQTLIHKTIPTAHCFPKNALHLVNICWFEYIASMIPLLNLCVHTVLAKWFIETDGKSFVSCCLLWLLGVLLVAESFFSILGGGGQSQKIYRERSSYRYYEDSIFWQSALLAFVNYKSSKSKMFVRRKKKQKFYSLA